MPKFARILSPLLAISFIVALTAGCSAKARMGRHLQRADKYFKAGQYPKAEVEYLNVLQLDARNARAFSRLGTIYLEQGCLTRAYPCLGRAVSLAPKDVDAHFMLGSLYLSGGKVKEAQQEANLILYLVPGHGEAPMLLPESVAS